MSLSPLVTVITPAYNVAEYIGETIRSVLAQTEPRFDYLVIDDGSSDGTATVVQELARRDARVRLIATEQRGSGSAQRGHPRGEGACYRLRGR
jgi:glycosyltransferase involved in cell wall biosynthesis